ncbi:hypothetical protein KQH61_06105 [bacterium]|nr:hypothetical protein [bacterium]
MEALIDSFLQTDIGIALYSVTFLFVLVLGMMFFAKAIVEIMSWMEGSDDE